MDAGDVVKLIQYYRHDLLNHLQVVEGYIQLGNLKKAETAMRELIDHLSQERKLDNLNIPNVFLWFQTFNQKYENFNLIYDVDIENKNLQEMDLLILDKLNQIMNDIKSKCRKDTVHHVEIEFKDSISDCMIAVYVDNQLEADEKLEISQSGITDIDLYVAENEQIYSFHISYP